MVAHPAAAAPLAAPETPRPALPPLPPLRSLPPLPEPFPARDPAPALVAPPPASSPGWTPAPPPEPVSTPPADPAPIQPAPVARPATPAPPVAAAPRPGVEAMTLLRAADMVAPLPPPPPTGLTTLAALSTAPGAAAPGAQPRNLFPLIEALDLPGGLQPRRDTSAAPPPPAAMPALRARPVLVPAADVEMPLPDLLRLLAAGPDGAADAYTAMRRPPRADRPTT
ncbi:hypothetical protein G3576_13910 [Roseomonas stagni]|uniref:Uncharacterized protein n=1 Tax=Falsiroseomonas algicola TaxID=2716930 RepID=A0A6M1LMU7_9PROT|nr:hypothetical protein [Falsiroseomonas algicola]NGM21114.1 hypothetical protein [Falsiroseomonas algicola]